jgi:hypothetical protein
LELTPFFQFLRPTDHINRPKALVSNPVYHYQHLFEENGLTEVGDLVTGAWSGVEPWDCFAAHQ